MRAGWAGRRVIIQYFLAVERCGRRIWDGRYRNRATDAAGRVSLARHAALTRAGLTSLKTPRTCHDCWPRYFVKQGGSPLSQTRNRPLHPQGGFPRDLTWRDLRNHPALSAIQPWPFLHTSLFCAPSIISQALRAAMVAAEVPLRGKLRAEATTFPPPTLSSCKCLYQCLDALLYRD